MNTCVNGINYYFKLDNADTSEDFYQKNWFISKLNPQNEEEANASKELQDLLDDLTELVSEINDA